jgi:tetratricopeptide (TPR) repeat protein
LVGFLLTLLALAGLAAYLGARQRWRESEFRAVRQALDRRDFARARTLLARCLERWPQDAELRLLAAQAARRGGDFAEAEKQLVLCQQLKGDPDGINLERALAVAQDNDPAEVGAYLFSHARRGPEEAALVFEASAQGYLKTQRLDQALHCLDRWLEHRPDNVQALLWRGQVLERWNELEEAVSSYRRAVAADPGHEQARRLLALALARSDRAREAAGYLERLPGRRADPEILLGLARCRRSLGQVDEARRLLDEVLALQPRHAEALGERGKLALHTGRPAEAEGWLNRALAQAPYDRDTNYTFYLCLEQQGRKEEAARALEKVERIRADLQRVSDLRRQVAASPHDPSLRCQVGILFLRNGQTEQGLRWLRSALQIDPRHAESLAALAKYAPQTKD